LVIQTAQKDGKKASEKQILNQGFEKGKEMFSIFSEVELEAEHLINLISLCFKYLPSHVEIIEPQKIHFDNFDISSVLNEIVTKMHNYDAIAKSAIMNNQILY
jgi:hypothetical protein